MRDLLSQKQTVRLKRKFGRQIRTDTWMGQIQPVQECFLTAISLRWGVGVDRILRIFVSDTLTCHHGAWRGEMVSLASHGQLVRNRRLERPGVYL